MLLLMLLFLTFVFTLCLHFPFCFLENEKRTTLSTTVSTKRFVLC
ncbi:hypothetical protein WN944_013848 [Citrus x changshan-huyou]|uniref:Uncharacterized protein n=1 Tax=Citrus x changshan-huyou TaxID=2935761 RepID=A0AAP0M5Z8_9ROSI